jgi:tRNA dimethylallyltransferase
MPIFKTISPTSVFADASPLTQPASRLFSSAGPDSLSAAGSLSPGAVVEPLGHPTQDAGRGEDHPVIAILGPTAAGKSALGLELAEGLKGEIVNYDSVQVYCGFDLGSGKVPPEERRGIPHHLIDRMEPHRVFTAGDYRREALRVLAAVRERGKLPILVGGTGLYLRALLLGLFEGPPRSEALRARLRAIAERRSREFLHRLLRRMDQETAERVRARDTQKVIRALEVCLQSRRPFSALLASGRRGLEGFRVLKLGLNPDRAELYRRINQRVESMFAAGLLEETRTLLARPDATRFKPLGALGYRQSCAALAGEMSLGDAIRETQAATRRYAKRQLTWFRRETDVTWFEGFGDDPEIQRQVVRWLSCRLPVAAGQQAK